MEGLLIAVILPGSSPLRSELCEELQSRGAGVEDFDESSDFDEDATPQKYNLIIVDWRVPFAAKFVEKIKVPRRSSRTPVLAIYPQGADPKRPEVLTIAPEESAYETSEVAEVLSRAERILNLQRSRPRVFFQDMIIRLPSKDDELERLYEVFDELLIELGFDDQEQVTVGYSFREAVGNAFEHGNGKDESKIIHVLYMVDHEKMCIAVTDEGDGFDHVTYVAEKSQESAYATTTGRSEDIRPGGLGFHMMRKAYDKITYNDSGNTIYLMKFLPGAKDEG